MISPFRQPDSETLQDNVKVAIQIRAKIAELCTINKISPYELPASLVPSAQLYDLVVSFEAMYNKLLDYNLVQTGNFRANKANIH